MNRITLSLWRGLRAGMARLGEDIAILVNSLLLFLVYVVGVGITSLVARVVGKKFLDRAPHLTRATQSSYWRDVKDKKPDLDSHFRQF